MLKSFKTGLMVAVCLSVLSLCGFSAWQTIELSQANAALQQRLKRSLTH